MEAMTREETLVAALERIRDWPVSRITRPNATHEMVDIAIVDGMQQCASDAVAQIYPVVLRESVHALRDA